MNEKIEKVKDIMKLCGQASVQMMLGGLAAAVIPPSVGIPFKVVYFVGSCIVASCSKSAVDKAVDEGFNDIMECVEQTKKNIEILKS